MTEIKLIRMQRLTAEAVVNRIIQIISRKRMTDITHMDSDLMCPPCFEMKLQQRIIVRYSKTLKVGNG